MCGIVGLISKENAVPGVLEALKRLEYRGYDSAGIAAENGAGITRQRATGNIKTFEAHLKQHPISGPTAIGHIRWATHGVVNETNAHPHMVGRVAVVHNGIIENFKELRAELGKAGVSFETDTDTEVVAALINLNLTTDTPTDAVRNALPKLEGAFALGIMIEGEAATIFAARRGSPLVIGFGDRGAILGSDTMAIAGIATRVCYLEEGDFAILKPESAEIFDADGKKVSRDLCPLNAKAADLDKGNYAHYMQKEIFEQPTAISDTLGKYIDPLKGTVDLGAISFDFEKITKLNLIACGTSYYAALTARYWFETYAGLPVEVEMASEFRYRDVVQTKGELNLFISQSGETLDTLMALRHCREKGLKTAAIVNVADSTMTREAGETFLTFAGVEIGVASTKAYTCQLSVLAALAVAAGRARGTLSESQEAEMVETLSHLPSKLAEVLYHDEAIQALAPTLSKAKNVLYLGRGALYPVALEGALKLKEISYIHAEGYPAGEMKHGPIALIEDGVPVVILAPTTGVHKKTLSNMQEAYARKASIILVSDKEGVAGHKAEAFAAIEIPDVSDIGLPILYAVPVQLIAYHTAVAKGTNVDQPRNLAKSVTVE